MTCDLPKFILCQNLHTFVSKITRVLENAKFMLLDTHINIFTNKLTLLEALSVGRTTNLS